MGTKRTTDRPAPPRQCAAVVVEDERGRILMVRQGYGQGLWGLPGGVVDPGETPLQAAVREAREEVGLTVTLTETVGVYLLQGGGWPDIQAYVFRAAITSGMPRAADPAEIAEVAWTPLASLPARLLDDAAAALDDLRAGKRGAVRTVRRHVWMGDIAL